MPAGAFNLGEYPGHDGICQTLFLNPVSPVSDLASIWVLGGPLLKGYYTVWNGTHPEQLQFGVAELKANAASGGNSTASPSPTPTPVSGGMVFEPSGMMVAVGLAAWALVL